LGRFDLQTAIQDKTLAEIADSYNHVDGTFSSGFWGVGSGYPVITFNRQLKYNTFPMAPIINRVLQLGEEAMGCPVEIEFAGVLPPQGSADTPSFYLLQLRPFLEHEETLSMEIEVSSRDKFVFSKDVSGNRVIDNIHDIVYIKPDAFDSTQTLSIAAEVNQLNRALVLASRPYILIGPGRWGTQERHLGVPVDWTAINGARVIMEVDLPDFHVDHSQGSHFFHNITSAGIPFIYVKHGSDTSFLDWDWLNAQKVINETHYLRHVRTKTPLLVMVNGKKREGQIIKPKAAAKWL
jgi:hypothetical protein